VRGEQLAYAFAAVCAFIAAAVFILGRIRVRRALEKVRGAEQALALLAGIAPAFTDAATDSASRTCERIIQRFGALVRAQTTLCIVASNGRLLLGAKSGSGYADFLKPGDPCDGDSIVDWVADHALPAVIGPNVAGANLFAPHDVARANLFAPHDVAGAKSFAPTNVAGANLFAPDSFVNLASAAGAARSAAPLVGSRDRVWALCVPMLQPRGYGLRPKFVGAIYAERAHNDPFTARELGSATLVARLAADALVRAQFADEVKRESEVDQLTQLLTATAFRKRLRQEIEARRYATGQDRPDVALFFIDTDKFKLWNDSFGHVVGDLVLKRLAQILRDVAATGGFAGRNGGDEFCIALLDRTKDDAIEVAEHLRRRVERTDLGASEKGIPSPRIPVTISIGVAHFPVDVPLSAAAPSDMLLESADARMYEAKRAGGNAVAYSRTRALPTKLRYPGEGPIPRR
jgi:diguanylate cyclase (GGDEF)-like protein